MGDSPEDLDIEEPMPKPEKFWLILVIILFLIAAGMSVIFFFYDSIFTQTKENYLMKVTRECGELQDRIVIKQVVVKTNQAIYLQANLNTKEITDLEKISCVLGVYTTADAEQELVYAREQLANDLTEDIQSWKLKRTIVGKDLTDKESLLSYLQEKHDELAIEIPESPEIGIISPFQYYVTPDQESVKAISNKFSSNEDIYLATAMNWVWVSEQTLNNQEEKWLTPEQFLTETPDYSTNPVPGKITSDCSEQANTLTSALRANGVPATDVRVVLGVVNFEGSIGGHAWVELKQGNNWLVLDPTSGPYFDDETSQLVETSPIPFEYFLYHEFPVVERWYFYNDQYYKDLVNDSGNAPGNWSAQANYNQQIEFQVVNINPEKNQKLKEKLFNN